MMIDIALFTSRIKTESGNVRVVQLKVRKPGPHPFAVVTDLTKMRITDAIPTNKENQKC